MSTRSDSSNSAVRAALTILGKRRDAAVLGLAPGDLSGKKIKATLLDEFSGRCAYCEKTISDGFDVDHLVPMNRVSLGLHMYGNLVPACKPCNGAKKAKTLEAFLRDAKIPNAKRVQSKLEKRAVKYGADLDSVKIRKIVEELHKTISELILIESERAFKLLPQPTSETIQAAKTLQKKSEYDFSEISKRFPIGCYVESGNDGTFGEVCDYSLQGPKQKRTTYITYQPVGGGKLLRRSPGTLRVIKSAS